MCLVQMKTDEDKCSVQYEIMFGGSIGMCLLEPFIILQMRKVKYSNRYSHKRAYIVSKHRQTKSLAKVNYIVAI